MVTGSGVWKETAGPGGTVTVPWRENRVIIQNLQTGAQYNNVI